LDTKKGEKKSPRKKRGAAHRNRIISLFKGADGLTANLIRNLNLFCDN